MQPVTASKENFSMLNKAFVKYNFEKCVLNGVKLEEFVKF